MRFLSTRGEAPPVGFLDMLLGGLAPDGGLYAPEAWPQVPPRTIAGFAERPYAEVAADILARFAGEAMGQARLLTLCREAYGVFDHEAVAPLRQLGPDRFLLELFHGPSLAFKDIALQLLARLTDEALRQAGRRLTIVCATSGDTGGAAVEAFRGRSAVGLVVLFPAGRISQIQRRFMTTANEANVRCLAVDGDFDACQALVKALFRDAAFREEVALGAVNSINFVRILAQSVYYFTAAAALGAPAREIAFAVPSGNFGDAFAGWAARRMGLPIRRILAATNANDVLARALAGGLYERGEVVPTSSPAMDIQAASNLERLVFELAGRDGAATRRLLERFEQTGSARFDPALAAAIGEVFTGASASEAEVDAAMRASIGQGGVVDPHTAVALATLRNHDGTLAGTPVITLATAHPAKFPEAVEAATGAAPPEPEAARRVRALSERFEPAPARVEAIKVAVREMARAA